MTKNSHDNPEVSVFIQARMGSTRLPGKVLMLLEGKPVIEHVVSRLRQSKHIQRIVVVTSTESRDSVLMDVCRKLDVGCFAGSENDVLNRYFESSRKFPSSHIVRVTADCPLVDSEIIDAMIDLHLKERNNYTSFAFDQFPRGVGGEVFRREDLERIEKTTKESHEREHVTPYFYQHPEKFKLGFLKPSPVMKRPDLRLTLDTPEDFALITEIYKGLYRNGKLFTTSEVIEFLDKNPELIELNKHIQQKPLINQ